MHAAEKEATAKSRGSGQFWVEKGKDDRFYVCRTKADGKQLESISYEAFVYLECLLAVPADVPVASKTIIKKLGSNKFRPRDMLKQLPEWVKEHIEAQPGKGSWIRSTTSAAEPKLGRG